MISWIVISIFDLTTSVGNMIFKMLRKSVLFCECQSQRPRHAMITGATSGIGLATAFELARRNWTLTLACRNVEQANDVKHRLISDSGNLNINVKKLDLTNLESIKKCVECLSLEHPIEVLINNAGIMSRSLEILHSVDTNMMTNCVGPVYLFKLMRHHFKKVKTNHSLDLPRVIFVSSSLASKGNLKLNVPDTLVPLSTSWNATQSYANSKQALNLCAQEIFNRYGKDDEKLVNIYTTVTGGMVNTNLNRKMIEKLYTPVQWLINGLATLLLKTPQEGCQSIVHCAVSEDVFGSHVNIKMLTENCSNGSGILYRNCCPIIWPESSQSTILSKKVYSEVEAIFSNF